MENISLSKNLNVSNSSFFKNLTFGNILLYSLIGISLLTYILSACFTPHPSKSSFIIFELLKQSSLIYLIVQMVGLSYIYNITIVREKHYLIVPILISVITYTLSITMGYAQTSSCEKPKRDKIFLNSLIPVISVVLGYIFVTKVSIVRTGFYDLVGDPNSEMALWSAIGYWMAGFALPGTVCAYFLIERSACNSNSEIKINPVTEVNSSVLENKNDEIGPQLM